MTVSPSPDIVKFQGLRQQDYNAFRNRLLTVNNNSSVGEYDALVIRDAENLHFEGIDDPSCLILCARSLKENVLHHSGLVDYEIQRVNDSEDGREDTEIGRPEVWILAVDPNWSSCTLQSRDLVVSICALRHTSTASCMEKQFSGQLRHSMMITTPSAI